MTSAKHFASDNHAGAHPSVLAALSAANSNDADAYGGDEVTARLRQRVQAIFGSQAQIFPVFTGTAANLLGLASIVGPPEGVICADSAHIHEDEAGAAERFIGCKLLPVATPDGKLTPELVRSRLPDSPDPHTVRPGAVSVAQSTELGTCYSLAELKAVAGAAREHGLLVHIDGARLANALAYLGCAPSEIADCADVMSFGGTKNGALGAEAIITLHQDAARLLPALCTQGTHLASKMRFVSAQLLALLDDELWLANATNANEMARRLSDGLAGLSEVELAYPVEANAVFARLPAPAIERLRQRWSFHNWDHSGTLVRWMTAFDTRPEDVDEFLADIRAVVTAFDGSSRESGAVSRETAARDPRSKS